MIQPSEKMNKIAQLLAELKLTPEDVAEIQDSIDSYNDAVENRTELEELMKRTPAPKRTRQQERLTQANAIIAEYEEQLVPAIKAVSQKKNATPPAGTPPAPEGGTPPAPDGGTPPVEKTADEIEAEKNKKQENGLIALGLGLLTLVGAIIGVRMSRD